MSKINDLQIPLSAITGDFNSRFLKWWSLDIENAEGREITSLISACGYSQITHITKKSSSCIDLVFTASPNLISNTGVELSIFEKYHHKTIYGIIDFKVPLRPPILTEVWDYINTNSDYIQSAVSNTDWELLF